MTFHSACARLLRAEAGRLGYTRQFTIYDQADARRLTKRCLDEIGADTKRFTPAAVHNQISDAKNKLRDADAYRQLVGSFFESTVADVYDLYEREMHRANAMDFDDLLVRTVNVLELFQEVRDHYQQVFRHVLVDEYQDTNHAQYRLLQLITSEHRNLAVVGDDAQCLLAGTPVTMADGTTKPIELVEAGDEVLSCYGSGDFRPARVTDTFANHASMGVAITTRGGRRARRRLAPRRSGSRCTTGCRRCRSSRETGVATGLSGTRGSSTRCSPRSTPSPAASASATTRGSPSTTRT
jgi:hypothetical protein